jgi:hypothetical protein
MANNKRKTETVKISRLGCMRKSTVEVDMTGSTVEHIEVWMDEPEKHNKRPLPDSETSPAKRLAIGEVQRDRMRRNET